MVIQGVIRPPPEIRVVADRTALYVAKNGRAFEVRILNSEKGKTPKFAFLQPDNPFHAYYEDRILFYENGGEEKDSNKTKEDERPLDPKKANSNDENDNKNNDNDKNNKKEKGKIIKSASDPVAKAILTQRNKIAEYRLSLQQNKDDNEAAAKAEETNQPAPTVVPPPPPPFYFVNIVAPSSLTVAQIETIQLVAQMTALDGKKQSSNSSGGGFLQTLTLREWNNPEFSFCHPRHGHFAYFSALVDAYRRILSLWTTTNNSSSKSGSSGITNSIVPDGDYTPLLANNVVKCLEMAAYRSEYELDQMEQRRKGAAGDNGGSFAAANIDWQDFVVVETIDFPVDEKVLTLAPPPPPPPRTASAKSTQPTVETVPRSALVEDMQDGSDEEEEEEQIRVVPSYTPKVVSAQANALEMVIDPITGKSVPVKDMPEHMRIQLLDPKWAEERKKFAEKQKESNLVGGDVIASNLARFVQARGMGSEQDALSREDAKKRLLDANRVLREQALHSSTQVGPLLLPAGGQLQQQRQQQQQPHIPKPNHPPPSFDNLSAQPPDAKKARFDVPTTATQQQQSAIPTTLVKAPPVAPKTSEDPFAAALSVAETGTASVATGGHTFTEPVSEAVFAASLPRPDVTLQVRFPNDPAYMVWNFYGQIVSLSIHVMTKVREIKQELSQTHLNNMPANKIQLKDSNKGVFLKDGMSLAALNIGPTATLDLIPKTRGGRK